MIIIKPQTFQQTNADMSSTMSGYSPNTSIRLQDASILKRGTRNIERETFQTSNFSNLKLFKLLIPGEDPVSAFSSVPPIVGDSIHPPWPDDRIARCPVLSNLYSRPGGYIQVVQAGCPGTNRTVPTVHRRSPRAAGARWHPSSWPPAIHPL